MRKFIAGVLLTFVVMSIGSAVAGSIKTWSNGEILSSSDLNSNFSHVHSASEALITNAKVDASAAIAHSKLATPSLVPKAWGLVGSVCSADPCTVSASSGVTGVGWNAEGRYTVTLSSARANAVYGVLLTPIAAAAAGANSPVCYIDSGSTTTQFTVSCYENDAGDYENAGFAFALMDDDN